MRTLAEVTREKDESNEDGEAMYETRKYYLVHWGTKYQIIDVGENRFVAVNRTVAVCQDYETGQIECFEPEQLKILGFIQK